MMLIKAIYNHLEYFEPFETISDLLRPFETFWEHFVPIKTIGNYWKFLTEEQEEDEYSQHSMY